MSNTKYLVIIDVGLGNIRSIQRMVEKVGGQVRIIHDPSGIDPGSKVILPGVGHFDAGMTRLTQSGFAQVLTDPVIRGSVSILGICLGMQLLCRSSDEGKLPGLGLIDADVKLFCFPKESTLKVPHMGWNIVSVCKSSPILSKTHEEQRFYFVHSYKVVPANLDSVIATAFYGGEFCVAVQKERVYGVQFHPEKSHRFGMALLKNFVES